VKETKNREIWNVVMATVNLLRYCLESCTRHDGA